MSDPQLTAMRAWLDSQPPRPKPPYNPADYEDEDTLRRSRLSRTARKSQRTGAYFPTIDDQGLDRDGWEHGARYGGQS